MAEDDKFGGEERERSRKSANDPRRVPTITTTSVAAAASSKISLTKVLPLLLPLYRVVVENLMLNISYMFLSWFSHQCK